MTLRTFKSKLNAARKSLTVWALGVGLFISEALPHLVDALPMAQQAFDEDTYKMIVRFAFVLGIVLRVRRVGTDTTEGK